MGRLGLLTLACSLTWSGMTVAQSAPSTQTAPPSSGTPPAATNAATKPATHAATKTKIGKIEPAKAKTAKPATTTEEKPEGITPEGITHDQADAILDELRAIHQLLVAQGPIQATPAVPVPAKTPDPIVPPAAPDKVHMSLASGWHWLGRDDAPVTIVEFTDYQCPFCRKYHIESFTRLKKNFIDTGKVRFVSRDLPLDFHPNAHRAAESAWCAGEQNKYWELRDAMIINSNDLSKEAIAKYAQANALDLASFQACVDAGKYKAEIQQSMTDANMAGISATPSFVIGKTVPNQIDGDRVVGAVPEPVFENEIQKFMTANP